MFASIFNVLSSAPIFSKCGSFLSRIRLKKYGLLFAVIILQPLSPAFADLMVAPKRVIFENNQRSAQLDLINNGTETLTFRISLVNRRMTETGGFMSIDTAEADEQFADKLLRYSPRQVVLAPGEGQMVRIILRKPADLAIGEYRSHLLFKKVAAVAGVTDIETVNTPTTDLSVQLTMLVGISIPVIVRQGDTAATVDLTDLKLIKATEGRPAMLGFVLQRGGNQSIYGDLNVRFTPKSGAPYDISKASGVAVYTPNPLRRVKLVLKEKNGQALSQGTLTLSFKERPEDGGKLLSEQTLVLP